MHSAALVCVTPGLPAQVTEETEALRFNTGIAAMMEFVNGVLKWAGPPPAAALEPFLLLLAPYAPHLAEEMWQARLPLHLAAERRPLPETLPVHALRSNS